MYSILESPPVFLSEYGIEFFITVRSSEGFTAHKHIHPAVEFIYVQEGQFEIEAEERRILASPNDLVLFRANTVHVIKKIGEGQGVYYVLKLSPSFLFSMFQKNSLSYILPFLKSGSGDTCHYPESVQPVQIKEIWRKMIGEYEANEPSFFAMQRFLACEFLLNCARHLCDESTVPNNSLGINEPNFRRISDSVNYINENYASPLTACECAALANLSYSHYAKLFHAVVGKSFKEYLTEIRMVKAYNMLLSSPESVSDVAMMCGYENFSHFIAEFKKKYSCTPGKLRKNIKK